MRMNNVVWTRGKLEPEKKQLIVAIDHGMSYPDMPGLEMPISLLKRLASNADVDGLIASPGIYMNAARQGIDLSQKNRLLVMDFVNAEECAGKSLLKQREMIISPEEGDLCKPDAYKFFFNIYPDKERMIRNCKDLSNYVTAASQRGISCLAEIMFYENEAFSDPQTQAEELFKGCRMAMELGADVLKIPLIHDKDAIGEMIDRLGLPTFILGGSKYPNLEQMLMELEEICKQPICGLMFGRNIWQSADMEETIRQICATIKNKEDEKNAEITRCRDDAPPLGGEHSPRSQSRIPDEADR